MTEQTASNTGSNPKREEERTAIARELERRFQLAIDVFNERDYLHETPKGRETLSYISPSCKAEFDNVPGPLDWQGLTHVFQEWQKQEPDLKFSIHSAQTHVDLEKGEAVVYCEITVTGVGDVTLGGLSEAQWKRKSNGKWKLEHYQGMRGITHNGGFV